MKIKTFLAPMLAGVVYIIKLNVFFILSFLCTALHMQAISFPMLHEFIEKTSPNYVIHTKVGERIILHGISQWVFEVPNGKNTQLITVSDIPVHNGSRPPQKDTIAAYQAISPGKEILRWKPIITTPWWQDFFHIFNPSYWYFEQNCRTWEIVVHDQSEKTAQETPYTECLLRCVGTGKSIQ
jgi:hypothetical protein